MSGFFRNLVKRYDGAAWRELVRRHPRSAEAAEARRRLDEMSSAASAK